MNQSAAKSTLNEIKNFSVLEEKIDKLLERLTNLKDERDTLVKQLVELERVLREREAEITELREKLRGIPDAVLDSQKSAIIKKKLAGILEKLEEI